LSATIANQRTKLKKRKFSSHWCQDYRPRDAHGEAELGAERLGTRSLADVEARPHPQEVALLVAELRDELLGPLDGALALVFAALPLGRLALPVLDGPILTLLPVLQHCLLNVRQLLHGPFLRHRCR
jgi:hypothetical protein